MEIACVFQPAQYSSMDATLCIQAQEIVRCLEKMNEGVFFKARGSPKTKASWTTAKKASRCSNAIANFPSLYLEALRIFMMQATS